MKFECRSVLDYGILESLELMNQGFSDYIVPIQLKLPSFYEMLRTSNIDLNLSQVAVDHGSAVGISLIARRGWSSRLATMAIIPEARGKKFGKSLLAYIVDQAKKRGDQRFELEVIEQNYPAVQLYKSFGFLTIRRLVSYRVKNPIGQMAEIKEVDIREVATLVNHYGLPNLPWQLSSETIAALGPPNRAFSLNSAYVVISAPENDTITLRSLITLPGFRKMGLATKLVKALFAQYPEKTWMIPAIFPEEMDYTFAALGFERQEISQFQMEINLDP